MSTGNAISLLQANYYLKRYLPDIERVCVPGRCQVVGSVRRHKLEVHDIELLVIPHYDDAIIDMFGGEPKRVSRLDSYIHDIVRAWNAELITNGPKTKNILLREGITLQIFVSDSQRWGVEMVIKTGPSDFSAKCVTSRLKGGYLPSNARIADGWQVYEEDKALSMPGETHFLNYLGLGWVEPQDRHPGLKWR